VTLSPADKRRAFRALHRDGCFILPNPWDIGSARVLEAAGFKALASTSSGAAAAVGRKDGELTRDEVLAHLRGLAAATDLPLNADFEGGFADDPEEVAANVALAVETGVAGLSIEDRTGRALYETRHAVERIAAARAAIDGEDVILVARTEGFLIGQTDVHAAIDRLVTMAQAGADCLYAPGMDDPAAIAALVRAVAPKAVNVLLRRGAITVPELADLGVRRVSTGGELAHIARRALEAAAQSLVEVGGYP